MSRKDVHFRIDKKNYEVLKTFAKAEDRATAAFVARIVRRWIIDHPTIEDVIKWNEDRLNKRREET